MAFPPVNRATTLEPGNFEVGGYLEAVSDPTLCCAGGLKAPGLGAGARVGVTDGFDLGIRSSLIGGAELSAKVRLLQRGQLTLTVMPALSSWLFTNGGAQASVALLGGYTLADRVELVLAPRLAYAQSQQTEFGGGDFRHFDPYLGAGGSGAVFVLVGNRTRLAFGVSVHHLENLRPLYAQRTFGVPHLQAGLGVLVTIGKVPEH